MIEAFIRKLRDGGVACSPEEIADALWLAQQIRHYTVYSTPQLDSGEPVTESETTSAGISLSEATSVEAPSSVPLTDKKQEPRNGTLSDDARTVPLIVYETTQTGVPYRAPGGAALPGSLNLARALRPLLRRVPSRSHLDVDESATVQSIAETDLQVWNIALRPSQERWLSVDLVIDQSPSMVIWHHTAAELQRLLERHGAFRVVRQWNLQTQGSDNIRLYPAGAQRSNLRVVSKSELLDPAGRRLVLILSDCVADAWHSGVVFDYLETWARSGPTALLQVLPERFWPSTALGSLRQTKVFASKPGSLKPSQVIGTQDLASTHRYKQGTPLPVITLTHEQIGSWAALLAGRTQGWIPAFILGDTNNELSIGDDDAEEWYDDREAESVVQDELSSYREQLDRIRATLSPESRRLVAYLSFIPLLTVPIMRLVQRVMVPGASQVHLAEVFLSGLLQQDTPPDDLVQPHHWLYSFRNPLVASLLHSSVPASETVMTARLVESEVMDRLSALVGREIASALSIDALLLDPDNPLTGLTDPRMRPFAEVRARFLRRLGKRYAALADRLQHAQIGPIVVDGLHREEVDNRQVDPGADPLLGMLISAEQPEQSFQKAPLRSLAPGTSPEIQRLAGLETLFFERRPVLQRRVDSNLFTAIESAVRDFELVRITQQRLSNQAAQYPPDSPPPYSPAAEVLHSYLTQSFNLLQDKVPEAENLQKRILERSRPGFSQDFVQLFNRSHRQLLQNVKRLQRDLETLEARHRQADTLIRQLDAIPNKTITQLRQLQDAVQQGLAKQKQLIDSGVIGNELTEISQALTHVQRVLNTVVSVQREPEASLSPTVVAVLWSIRQRHREAVLPRLHQLDQWSRRLTTIDQLFTRGYRQAAEITQLFTSMTEAIDITTFQQSFAGFRVQLDALRDLRLSIDVSRLQPLYQDIAATVYKIESLHGTVIATRNNYNYLQGETPRLHVVLETISELIHGLAQRPRFPILWTNSSAQLKELNVNLLKLGKPDQFRTAEAVDTVTEELRDIVRGTKNLSDFIQGLSSELNRYTQLVDTLRKVQLEPWYERAEQLRAKANVYDAVNWPIEMRVPALSDIVRQLQITTQTMLPVKEDKQLPEAELPVRTARLSELEHSYDRLRADFKAIEARLAHFEQLVKRSRERLSEMLLALDLAIRESTGVNLEVAALEESMQKLRQRRSEGELLRFVEYPQGSVEKVDRRIEQWQADARVALEQAYEKCENALEASLRELDKVLKQSKALGSLEKEPTIMSAYRTARELRGRPTNRVKNLSVQDLAKSISVRFQQIHQAKQQVQDLENFNHPLQVGKDQLKEAENSANEQLAELHQLTTITWPPAQHNAQKINTLSSRAAQAAKSIEESDTAKEFRSRISTAISAYGGLENGVRNECNSIRTQRQQFESYVRQIEGCISALELQRNAYGNPDAVNDVIRNHQQLIRSRLTQLKRSSRPTEEIIAIYRIAQLNTQVNIDKKKYSIQTGIGSEPDSMVVTVTLL